jgi:hypothetical protein
MSNLFHPAKPREDRYPARETALKGRPITR